MPWEEFEALSKSIAMATADGILRSFEKSKTFQKQP